MTDFKINSQLHACELASAFLLFLLLAFSYRSLQYFLNKKLSGESKLRLLTRQQTGKQNGLLGFDENIEDRLLLTPYINLSSKVMETPHLR